jgi:hypothetical protein
MRSAVKGARFALIGTAILVFGLLFAVTITVAVVVLPVFGSPSNSDTSAPGWHMLPDTKLASVCPDDESLRGTSGCEAVIRAWGGAAADTKRNRLLVWGGGHHDYYGNEVYSLDVSAQKMTVLIPATSKPQPCVESQSDGKPTSRHTYYDLAYLPRDDKMFSFGGALAGCSSGGGSNATWTLDLNTLTWKQLTTKGGPNGQPGLAVVAYDPTTNLIFVEDLSNIFKFDPAKNSYSMVGPVNGIDYHQSGVIDSSRKLLLLIGGGQIWAVRIGKGAGFPQDWSSQVHGCAGIVHAPYPGLAFDQKRSLVVGWAGGNEIYLFNPDTKSCETQTFPGGPGPQQENGTNGRFAYLPLLDVFVLVNDWKQDAYLLRLPR